MGDLKYKVGDKVRIKSLDWYNKNINNNGIIICGYESFTHPMSHFCDKVVTIVTIQDDCYKILEDGGDWYWTDEMIEGLVEEKISLKLTDKAIKNNEMVVSVSEYILPEGYIIKDENGNVINATKIVLEKKKKDYPKTYEECCKVLGHVTIDEVRGYKAMLLNNLQMLLICRDTYWKIAGEEMGLGKPWEPDWTNQELPKYCIASVECQVKTAERYIINTILAFPTEEMRDAFFNAFREDIEKCKELL